MCECGRGDTGAGAAGPCPPCPQGHPCPRSPVMLEAENFTLFIKNSIRFPLFGFEK